MLNAYTNLMKKIGPKQPDIIWVSDVSYIKFQGKKPKYFHSDQVTEFITEI